MSRLLQDEESHERSVRLCRLHLGKKKEDSLFLSLSPQVRLMEFRVPRDYMLHPAIKGKINIYARGKVEIIPSVWCVSIYFAAALTELMGNRGLSLMMGPTGILRQGRWI